MSKRNIFLACGALVLTVASFLSTKGNKKFAGLSAYFRTTATSAFITLYKGASGTILLTTNSNAGKTAFFKTSTSGSSAHTLFSSKATTHRLYYAN